MREDDKAICDHVWMRTAIDRRICGYCYLAQNGRFELVWRDDHEIGHKLVHLMKSDGTKVYDSSCERCRLEQELKSEP